MRSSANPKHNGARDVGRIDVFANVQSTLRGNAFKQVLLLDVRCRSCGKHEHHDIALPADLDGRVNGTWSSPTSAPRGWSA
jgi:hypothetical protein